MWYFTWILGLGLALTFGVLNAIWLEVSEDRQTARVAARLANASPSGEV